MQQSSLIGQHHCETVDGNRVFAGSTEYENGPVCRHGRRRVAWIGYHGYLWVAMEKENQDDTGLKRLVRKCRMAFRRPENTEYYSEDAYREAEKRYVRFCVKGS